MRKQRFAIDTLTFLSINGLPILSGYALMSSNIFVNFCWTRDIWRFRRRSSQQQQAALWRNHFTLLLRNFHSVKWLFGPLPNFGLSEWYWVDSIEYLRLALVFEMKASVLPLRVAVNILMKYRPRHES